MSDKGAYYQNHNIDKRARRQSQVSRAFSVSLEAAGSTYQERLRAAKQTEGENISPERLAAMACQLESLYPDRKTFKEIQRGDRVAY